MTFSIPAHYKLIFHKVLTIVKTTLKSDSGFDGYIVASVPSIPGCYTQGKTLEEAKKRIKEVIRLCLDESPDYQPVSPHA